MAYSTESNDSLNVKVPKLTISEEKNCHPDHFNIFPDFLQKLIKISYINVEVVIMHNFILKSWKHPIHLYTRYPIVARRTWPLGRVRRASKGILHTTYSSSGRDMERTLSVTRKK